MERCTLNQIPVSSFNAYQSYVTRERKDTILNKVTKKHALLASKTRAHKLNAKSCTFLNSLTPYTYTKKSITLTTALPHTLTHLLQRSEPSDCVASQNDNTLGFGQGLYDCALHVEMKQGCPRTPIVCSFDLAALQRPVLLYDRLLKPAIDC